MGPSCSYADQIVFRERGTRFNVHSFLTIFLSVCLISYFLFNPVKEQV